MYDLINVGTGSPRDKVTLHSFSKEEVDGVDKFNYAHNTLDKDHETLWAADDDDIIAGDFKGDGEFIIYDLSSIHAINLIRFSTTDKSDAFGFQVWASTTGTAAADFSMMLPTTGELLLTETNTTDFNHYQVDAIEARYIKLIGFGRFNADVDMRTSVWSAVREIEFYGSQIVSVDESDTAVTPTIYPVPAKDIINIKSAKPFDSIYVYDVDGNKVIEKNLPQSTVEYTLDISSIPSGVYFISLQGAQQYPSKKFVIIE